MRYRVRIPYMDFETVEIEAETKDEAFGKVYDKDFSPREETRRAFPHCPFVGLRDVYPPHCRRERGKLPVPDYTFLVEEVENGDPAGRDGVGDQETTRS